MKPCPRWSSISILLLLVATSQTSQNSTNGAFGNDFGGSHETKLKNGAAHSRCNSSCETSNVKVQFTATVVKNEYIVAFVGYYKPQTRENYIGAALNSSGVHNWKILFRDNPASGFPSDFDVVLLEETDKSNGLVALTDHPLVRRVTPQRLVYRSLKYLNSSEDADTPEYKNFKRKIKNYVRSPLFPLILISDR